MTYYAKQRHRVLESELRQEIRDAINSLLVDVRDVDARNHLRSMRENIIDELAKRLPKRWKVTRRGKPQRSMP